MTTHALNPSATQADKPRLQTVDQVAEKLCVSRATIWRYTARNEGFPRPIKLSPGCSRWRSDEVDAWIDSRETTTA